MRQLAAALVLVGLFVVNVGVAMMWETPAFVVGAGVSLILVGVQLARETTP